MKKIILFTIIITIIYSCAYKYKAYNDRGEVVGIRGEREWFSEKLLGMTLIPSGSFTMGKQDEDEVGTFSSPPRTVTVHRFYMDETEITNSEYKQFVYWVRDSVIRTKLAYKVEEVVLLSDRNDLSGGIHDFAFASSVNTKDDNPYEKYMQENYYDITEEEDPPKILNWKEDIIWDTSKYPDADYVEVMDSLYIKKNASINRSRGFNKDYLNYRYSWFDRKTKNKSTENKGSEKDSLVVEKVNIYPDTAVWVKDFNYPYNDPINYAYNDPMNKNYFDHKAYQDYPVVGVNWHQAKAFCNWKTEYKNNDLRKKRKATVSSCRLPTEAEWEYAARGGLVGFGKYPWGGPSTKNNKGFFLANFKPVRNYTSDGAIAVTMKVKSFKVNGYGLYNMAGNVSEWTSSAYNLSSYNPNVEDRLNNRKIIRGGSWKDVAYFLEVGSIDYEYADTARNYIGFRTVQSYFKSE